MDDEDDPILVAVFTVLTMMAHEDGVVDESMFLKLMVVAKMEC